MFSTELVTLFTGRTTEINVMPFSFNEIKDNVDPNVTLDQYIDKGGMGLIVDRYMNEQ
jgi:predicted AAA+ superfamily ATPase